MEAHVSFHRACLLKATYVLVASLALVASVSLQCTRARWHSPLLELLVVRSLLNHIEDLDRQRASHQDFFFNAPDS